jgi:hypothetical protein
MVAVGLRFARHDVLVTVIEIDRVSSLPSDAALAAARMLAAEGAHVVMVKAGGSQMRLHVAEVGAVDHDGVAEGAAVCHGGGDDGDGGDGGGSGGLGSFCCADFRERAELIDCIEDLTTSVRTRE